MRNEIKKNNWKISLSVHYFGPLAILSFLDDKVMAAVYDISNKLRDEIRDEIKDFSSDISQ